MMNTQLTAARESHRNQSSAAVAEAPATEVVATSRTRLLGLLSRFPTALSGALSIVDQAVVSATSFATAVIINRTFAPEDVGLYYLTVTVVLVALGVHEHVIAAPYTIYSHRYQGADRTAYAGSVWMHHAAITAVAVGLLLLAIAALSLAGSTGVLPALWALVGAGPLLLLREWIRRFAFADLDFAVALTLDTFVAAMQLGGLFALAYAGRLSLFNVYVVMGAACGLASLGWYLLRPPTARVERARVIRDWRSNWAFGRWALRSYLVHNTVPYVMVWVVGAAAGTAAAGLLGACTTLIGLTTLLLTGVDRFLTPRSAQAYVKGGPAALRRVLGQAAGFLLLTLTPLFLLVAVTGSWLAELVYGAGYGQCGPILVTLAAASLTTSLEMVAGIGLWSIDRPRANFLADLCSVAVTIGSAVLLVGPLGAWGAALATLAGSATAAIARSATLFYVLKSPAASTSFTNA
jgi:O-antigen/teichoic acid export membrane protein